jgi:hypothetical protein
MTSLTNSPRCAATSRFLPASNQLPDLGPIARALELVRLPRLLSQVRSLTVRPFR